MANDAEDVYETCILGKSYLGNDGQDNRDDEIIENLPVERFPVPVEENNCPNQQDADDILADNLECREADTLNVRDREILKDKDRGDNDDIRSEIDNRNDVHSQFPPDQERGDKERNRLHVPCRYPELGGKGAAPFGENTDSLVHSCMEEIENAYENEGNADKDEIVVLDNPPGFPDKEKNCNGNRDCGKLNRGMEKCEIILAYCIEYRDYKNKKKRRDDVLLQVSAYPARQFAEFLIFFRIPRQERCRHFTRSVLVFIIRVW
jgi:hypothetical protein